MAKTLARFQQRKLAPLTAKLLLQGPPNYLRLRYFCGLIYDAASFLCVSEQRKRRRRQQWAGEVARSRLISDRNRRALETPTLDEATAIFSGPGRPAGRPKQLSHESAGRAIMRPGNGVPRLIWAARLDRRGYTEEERTSGCDLLILLLSACCALLLIMRMSWQPPPRHVRFWLLAVV